VNEWVDIKTKFLYQSEKYAYVCRRKGAIPPTFRRLLIVKNEENLQKGAQND
jgi:hypothetical protein